MNRLLHRRYTNVLLEQDGTCSMVLFLGNSPHFHDVFHFHYAIVLTRISCEYRSKYAIVGVFYLKLRVAVRTDGWTLRSCRFFNHFTEICSAGFGFKQTDRVAGGQERCVQTHPIDSLNMLILQTGALGCWVRA